MIGLLPVAAVAVHQLRYMLAYGWNDGTVLRASGHSYLHSVAPWLVLPLALAAGVFLRAVGTALSGQRSVSRYAISLTGLWLLCSAALVAIFCCQELLEGVFATGHLGGLAGIFGYGGWWAIPAALCVGLVLAAVLHGAEWVVNEIAERCARARPPLVARRIQVARPCDLLTARLAPLAYGWSGRGPPR
ncbi:MAG TPA: hypothetical protein VGX45_16635 [Solirubrobacteraceae bacterium]|nr:hypothetical protein [Solirubrobacteraceae bacterium]